jgi:hypothetical protein
MDTRDEEFMLLSAIQTEDNIAAEDTTYTSLLSAAALLIGAENAHQAQISRRYQTRNFLCRPQLLPNPRIGTPWQALFHSRNDRAYITTMGFDVDTLEYLIVSGFGRRWLAGSIPRADVDTSGNSRPGRRSLDAWGALGLVLHHLNSTMTEISLQQIFGLIPSTVSRYIRFSLKILLETLREIPEGKIKWPRTDRDFQEYNNLIIARHPLQVGWKHDLATEIMSIRNNLRIIWLCTPEKAKTCQKNRQEEQLGSKLQTGLLRISIQVILLKVLAHEGKRRRMSIQS